MRDSSIERGLMPVLRGAATDGLSISVVVGPRACDKTALVRHLVDESIYQRYMSFAEPDTRTAAKQSPLTPIYKTLRCPHRPL